MATRAEHRRTTLLQISAATTRTFEELGAKATVDDIADRAGLSRRTLFRYAETKEDLLFIHPVLWLQVFDEAIAEVADQPLRERMMHGARRISEHIDRDPEPVRRAMSVAMVDPSMARGYAGVSRRWIDRLATEVRGSQTDKETVFKSNVLGAAIMGVIDAALADWFAADPTPSLAALVERGLDYLAPIIE